MAKFILGRKLGMTQLFADDGTVVPVTAIAAGPCEVTQLRTQAKDGYTAVQIGFEKKEKHRKKDGSLLPAFRVLWEVRVPAPDEFPVGTPITVDRFVAGDEVKVIGTSKGRGFAGPVKRHHFRGGPASHGHRHVLRQQGSTGQRFPQHTLKGLRMAGQMGNARVTVRKVAVVSVDATTGALLVKGAVPGAPGSLVRIVTM